MNITYKLQRDVVSRIAAVLVENLKTANSNIHIIYRNTTINGKSLVGVLNAHMYAGETIIVIIDDTNDVEKVNQSFKEIAIQVI